MEVSEEEKEVWREEVAVEEKRRGFIVFYLRQCGEGGEGSRPFSIDIVRIESEALPNA